VINQLISVALGGSVGALLRYFISTGVYAWLGKGFPYGTLAVNVIGSFLIGLMTEALVLQRVAIAMEYRAAILIGLFGSLTTFSTFSLDTFYLFEQGNYGKAGLNILVSVAVCLIAVWAGLSFGRVLFTSSAGVIHLSGVLLPYGIVIVNAIGACLIGAVMTTLAEKSGLAPEYRLVLMVVVVGAFVTFSSLYIILKMVELGPAIKSTVVVALSVVALNGMMCLLFFWAGSLLGRQV